MADIEKEIQLQDSASPANVKVSAPADSNKVIVQPIQSYQDRIIGAILENTAGTGLGIVITVAGAVFAAKFLGLPEMVKDFIANQKNMADSFAKLVDRIGDTVQEVEKTANKVDLIDRRIEKVETKLDHVEQTVNKLDK